MFVTHPHLGKGILTGKERTRGGRKKVQVLIEEGGLHWLSPNTIFPISNELAYKPIAPNMQIFRLGDFETTFDIIQAWRMIHVSRTLHVFDSLNTVSSLIIAEIDEKLIKKTDMSIPCLVGTYDTQKFIFDGNHRATRAVREGYQALTYYEFSEAEMRHLLC